MKRILFLPVLMIVFQFITLKSAAQFVSVPTTITTPHGKIRTHTPMYFPNTFLTDSRMFFKKKPKDVFEIVLLDDSLITVTSFLNFSDTSTTISYNKKPYQRTVKPAETRYINQVYEDGSKIQGIPVDNFWVFLADTGYIRTFSTRPVPGRNYIAYIQKGQEGEILELTKENLLPMLSDDQIAKQLAEKGKLKKAVALYNNRTRV